MSVHNDWAPLEEIIVGTAKGYRIPPLSRSFVKSQFPEYNEDDIPGLPGYLCVSLSYSSP